MLKPGVRMVATKFVKLLVFIILLAIVIICVNATNEQPRAPAPAGPAYAAIIEPYLTCQDMRLSCLDYAVIKQVGERQ